MITLLSVDISCVLNGVVLLVHMNAARFVVWCTNFDTGSVDPVTNHFAHTGSGSLFFNYFFLLGPPLLF